MWEACFHPLVSMVIYVYNCCWGRSSENWSGTNEYLWLRQHAWTRYFFSFVNFTQRLVYLTVIYIEAQAKKDFFSRLLEGPKTASLPPEPPTSKIGTGWYVVEIVSEGSYIGYIIFLDLSLWTRHGVPSVILMFCQLSEWFLWPWTYGPTRIYTNFEWYLSYNSMNQWKIWPGSSAAD